MDTGNIFKTAISKTITAGKTQLKVELGAEAVKTGKKLLIEFAPRYARGYLDTPLTDLGVVFLMQLLAAHYPQNPKFQIIADAMVMGSTANAFEEVRPKLDAVVKKLMKAPAIVKLLAETPEILNTNDVETELL